MKSPVSTSQRTLNVAKDVENIVNAVFGLAAEFLTKITVLIIVLIVIGILLLAVRRTCGLVLQT
jgi:hypothetical protein